MSGLVLSVEKMQAHPLSPGIAHQVLCQLQSVWESC